MVAADPQRVETESLQVANLPLSLSRITQFVHDIDPVLDPKGPERLAYLRCLLSFLEWSRQPQLSRGRLQQLCDHWKLAQHEGDRAICRWRNHDRELASHLARAIEAIELVERALAIYDQKIGRASNKPWWRALRWHRITMTAEDFRVLGLGRHSIELLDASRTDSDRRAQMLRDLFVVDFDRWQQVGGKWSETWLGELERQATDYWTIRFAESQALWTRSRATLITGLRLFFEVLEGVTASAVKRSEEMVLALSRSNVARLRELRAEIPSVPFSSPVLGPAFDAEADSALCQLAILQGTELDRRQASHPPDRPVAN